MHTGRADGRGDGAHSRWEKAERLLMADSGVCVCVRVRVCVCACVCVCVSPPPVLPAAAAAVCAAPLCCFFFFPVGSLVSYFFRS